MMSPHFCGTPQQTRAGGAWLLAKDLKDAADVVLKEARRALLWVLPVEEMNDEAAIFVEGNSVDSAMLFTEGRTIEVRIGRRDVVDLEVLEDLVTDTVFAQVTATTLNRVAFDSAVLSGLIPEDVVKACVTSVQTVGVREVIS